MKRILLLIVSMSLIGCNAPNQNKPELKTILCVKNGFADEYKFYSDADIKLIQSTLESVNCEQIVIDSE